jgi:PQQ-dependent dehydrogenase (s-GDH family)
MLGRNRRDGTFGPIIRRMPLHFAPVLAAAILAGAPQQSVPGPETFSTRVVASGLEGPWELVYGPDGYLWVTERVGKRVVRVNPADGTRTTAITIADVRQLEPQDGLLGMAIDADSFREGGAHHVYVAFTYDADPGAGDDRRLRVRRYSFDTATGTLGRPFDVLSNVPAGSDHVAGRLALGPDRRLYLTVGDQGGNQFGIFCKPIRAQELPTAAEVAAGDWQHYQGKILRIDLDGGIPSDNPEFAGVRSHIFTTGHRNAQGLAFAPNGTLYSSEHGPSMDDELNRIVGGRNYGWPYVAGYQDDQVYVYADWSRSAPEPCASLTWDAIVAPKSVPQQAESAWHDPAFMPPIQTFFTVDRTFDFSRGNATIGPSGIEFYARPGGGIPGWSNSVLVSALIGNTVYRVKLNDAGAVTGLPIAYFHAGSRYRDLALSPDGLTIYALVDGGSRDHENSIVAFRYEK